MAEYEPHLVFPSDLQSNDQYGDGSVSFSNKNFPFVMIEFFNWKAMTQDNNSFAIDPITTIFLPAPTSGLLESFAHDWNDGVDWNRGKDVIESKAAGYIVDKIKKYSDAGSLATSAYGNVTGTGFNDMLALSYGNMSLRVFDLTFDLVCRNKKDTEAITKITNTIKKLTTPSYGSSAIFEFPSICRLTAFANINKILFTTELAGVQQFNINYTPDGRMKILQDGEILQYQMLLTIKELRRKVISSGAVKTR